MEETRVDEECNGRSEEGVTGALEDNINKIRRESVDE